MLRASTVLASLITLAACDGDGAAGPAGDNDLLQQVQEQGWTDWARSPTNEERRASTAPHGGWVEIYTNEDIVAALANIDGKGLTAWPEDSTIVLAGFAEEKSADPVQLAIMQKRHGVWYWEQYDATNLERPRFSGRPDICVGCHAESSDFVRSFPLPKPVEDD